MDTLDSGSLGRAKNARRAHGSAEIRWLLVFLMVALAVCSITGLAVAIAMGETTVALVIGLVASAFFLTALTC